MDQFERTGQCFRRLGFHAYAGGHQSLEAALASRKDLGGIAAFLAACGAIAVRDDAAFRAARSRLASLAPGGVALSALDGVWNRVQAAL